ncbi:MAG TPA: glycoside hydrolase family 3 N-terminal domain-containing protein [Bradyrhizobium sp.]|jgi:beta-N-acetylhexosaminidase|nr:glycoside hydrolase family 3 N-terminal domain-containing protein [Bradyrhizobium sp.]
MRSAKPFLLFLAWLIGLALTFAAICKNDPFLVSLRGTGNLIIVASSLVVIAYLTRRGYWKRAGFAGRWLVLLWLLPPLWMLSAKASFETTRQGVLQTETKLAQRLGRHFIVGYSSFDEVARLAEKGLISGVYVSKSNVSRRKPPVIKAEIAALQERRRRAGLPPLIVAADQEGGVVSHLSPPLTWLPPLARLAELSAEARVKKAEELGKTQGRELSSLGINLDFAPVLDLKPKAKRNRFDFNTMTSERAISEDPGVVSDIALAYVRGLEASGVGATVKHFPGLGRVRRDTHIVSADLDTPIEQLEASDWRPFRDVLAHSKAQLMIGHVSLTAVDPGRPASHSKAVIDGIIRKKWNYHGVIITDDLVMGAVYGRNICTAVVEALNAGVDLLLVAFDSDQFYRIFACASEAAAENRLDSEMLRDSDARLQKNFAKPQPSPASTAAPADARPAAE